MHPVLNAAQMYPNALKKMECMRMHADAHGQKEHAFRAEIARLPTTLLVCASHNMLAHHCFLSLTSLLIPLSSSLQVKLSCVDDVYQWTYNPKDKKKAVDKEVHLASGYRAEHVPLRRPHQRVLQARERERSQGEAASSFTSPLHV